MAGKPASKQSTATKAEAVVLIYDGPAEYMVEPDTGTKLRIGDRAAFPSHIALRLEADSTVSVTIAKGE